MQIQDFLSGRKRVYNLTRDNLNHFRFIMDNKKKSNIEIELLMVGVAIPPSMMSKLAAQDKHPGMQGFNHQWETIRGIEEACGKPINLISFPMVSDFPSQKEWYIKGGRWHHNPESNDVIIPVINVFPLKLLFRFTVMIFEIIRWSFQKRHADQRMVFLYSSQSSQLLALLISSIFFKTCKFAILTDPPSMVVPGENIIKRSLRCVDRSIQQFALKRLQGLIVLAEGLAMDYAPGVPYLVVEGIAPTIKRIYSEKREAHSKFVIMFAGTLKKEYDIKMLLDSLQYLDNNVELWIFGRGDLEDEVREFEAHDSRLNYFGFLPPEELRIIAQKASAFISHLPTGGWFTRYKFPSKILEYMALGRPVISTRYPTIPREYGPYIVWIDEESPIGIAKAIRTVQSMSENERRIFSEQSLEFVKKNKSERFQGERAWTFASHIAEQFNKNN